MNNPRFFGTTAAAVLASLLVAIIALAGTVSSGVFAGGYPYPLTPEAAREGYFFGRGSDRAAVVEFLGRYSHGFSADGKSPYVGVGELHTPFERIVRRGWENPGDYSAQASEADISERFRVPRWPDSRLFRSLHGRCWPHPGPPRGICGGNFTSA